MQYQPKTYYIKTLGCQANVADSNIMAGILEALGFERWLVTKDYQSEKEELLDVLPNVDLFIINTCSVRQKSEDKVYGLGKVFKIIEEQGLKLPYKIISGCMVGSVTGKRQRYDFDILKKKTCWADLYISPNQVFELPHLLKEAGQLPDWAVTKLETIVNAVNSSKSFQPLDPHAFVNISYGCDNFCTYCVVPYAREEERSRNKQEILSEIKHLVGQGVKKLTLCGQNVNSWGLSLRKKREIRTGSTQKLPFAQLLREVHEIDGIDKIDFISSNPFDFTQDLMDVLILPKISNYLHIAVQSGNNEILRKMNRRHTIEDFNKLIKDIKRARPDIEFGTDIIVGFPNETRDQFMDTVKLFKKHKFNVAFISIYSPRKGTTAERLLKDDVSLKEKRWRHAYLTKVWKESLKK